MINELQLRQELDSLRVAMGSPLQRARNLIHLAHKIERGQACMVQMSMGFYGRGEPLRGALFFEASIRLFRLQAEARNCARSVLRCRPLSFGYAPRGMAYPNWRTSPAQFLHQEEIQA